MSIVQQVPRSSRHGRGGDHIAQLLSAVQRIWSKMTDWLRSLQGQREPGPTEEVSIHPASVQCTEIIEYNIDIGRRIDYFPGDTVGGIEVRIPYTAGYIPWRYAQSLEDQATTCAGFLELTRYLEAGLVSDQNVQGVYHPDLFPPSYRVPIHMATRNLQQHLALGDEAVIVYRYRPQLTEQFPVSIQAELADFPRFERLAELLENVPKTYLEDLCLRITVFGGMSNLSQEVEQSIVEWVQNEYRRVREEADAWKHIVEVLQGEGEQEPKALQQLTKTLGTRGSIQENTLRTVGRDSVPSLQEARSALRQAEQLLQCVQTVRDSIKSTEGALSTEGFREAVGKARRARRDSLGQLSDEWLKRLEAQVGRRLGGTRLRYVGVEWPLPEPMLEWPERPNPLEVLDQGWTYNPERHLMELYDVPLIWRAQEQRFEAVVELPLSRPPELSATGGPLTVKGRLAMETQRLLSGLQVAWLDKDGYKTSSSKDVISMQTRVQVNFEVDLEAAFHRRVAPAHRHLLFEGILPSEARRREIEHIFSDAGLTVLPNQRARGGRTLVRAIWREAGLPTEFLADLQGEETTARHVLVFDRGRQRVERSVRGGSLCVDLWALGAGEPSRISRVLDNIQILLQDRWGKCDSSIWQGTCIKEA
ncbi:MAG TPA: hypothetical protein VM075_09360 [Anaerolineae bacterium]|nr:hypothetical protein [Anaerolineae bacterium]